MSMRVLIADDEADFRMMLRLQLELETGWTVVGEANDGQEAIELSAELEPDVVIMDLLMPRMNGFDAIAHLSEHHPEITVIAHSAVAGGYARERISELGVPLVLKSGGLTPLINAVEAETTSGR